MTNKIKKFLYILVHLIPDGRDEIPTFALYHPLLTYWGCFPIQKQLLKSDAAPWEDSSFVYNIIHTYFIDILGDMEDP